MVNQTLVILNDTLEPGNFIAPDGGEPDAAAYDLSKGEVYVADSYSEVSVINDTTGIVVATIQVLEDPRGIAYDPAKGELFVAEAKGNNVTVINDTTNTVVANIPFPSEDSIGGADPTGIAYDSAMGEVFVTGPGNDDVFAVNDTNNSIVATIKVTDPTGIVANPSVDEIYVTSEEGSLAPGSLDVISDRTDTVLQSVTVGIEPSAVAIVTEENNLVVTNSGSGDVTVISDADFDVVATVGVGGDPDGVAYNDLRGTIFVANYDSANVTVLYQLTNTVVTSAPVGSGPVGLVDDSGHGEVFVTDSLGPNVTVLSDSNYTSLGSIVLGYNPVQAVYDSGRGEVFVVEQSANELTAISATSDSVVAEIPVGLDPSAVGYDSGKGELFVTDLSGGSVSVVSDQTDTVVATIPVGPDPTAVVYDNASGQVFVGSYASREVDVISDATDHVVATVPVYEYPISLAYDGGTGQVFVASGENVEVISTLNDTVVANLSDLWPQALTYDARAGEIDVVDYAFSALTILSDVTDRVVANVTFSGGNEPYYAQYEEGTGEVAVITTSGGSLSNLSLISDTTDTIVSNTSLAAFSKGLAYDPAKGTTFVPGYDDGAIAILYQPLPATEYEITVNETGLVTSTSWSLTLGGTPFSSSTGTIAASEPNGSYPYLIGPVPGFSPNPSAGSLTVQGRPVGLSIAFALTVGAGHFAVTFEESGLPPSTGWAVELGSSSNSSTTGSVGFVEPNGSYPYTIEPVVGYDADPDRGTVTVAGMGIVQDLSFSPIPGPGEFVVTFQESGLPSGTSWTVTLNGSPLTSVSTSINFTEENGSFAFLIGPVSNYLADPGEGSVVVRGQAAVQPVTFEAAGHGAPSIPSTVSGLTSLEGYLLVGGILIVVLTVVVLAVRRRRPPPRGPATPPPGASLPPPP